jgi:LacI family transcriptional regulator
MMQGDPADPTAILCSNDICAFGVMVGLADRGIEVGRDCAVVGFDDIAEAAHYRPALTTVGIDARRIGEEAANLLLRQIRSPGGAPESLIIPPKLVIRRSCGSYLATSSSARPAT